MFSVVIGAGTKVAIECDGDFWHGPDRYEADLARKRELQRCEWNFFNIRESVFYVDRAAVLAPLWELLTSLGVHPSGWAPPLSAAKQSEASPPRATGIPIISIAESRPLAPAENSYSAQRSLINDRSASIDEGATPVGIVTIDGKYPFGKVKDIVTNTKDVIEELEPPVIALYEAPRTAAHGLRLADYETFAGRCISTLTASRAQIIENLIAIIGVEGPVLGARLHQAHVRASGGQRVGRQIAHDLNSAITFAKKKGNLIADNPLAEQGVKALTYRLTNQPLYIVRKLGPRTLEQVPPLELAALLESEFAGGFLAENELFRAVLARYGLSRLTSNAITQLQRAISLRPITSHR